MKQRSWAMTQNGSCFRLALPTWRLWLGAGANLRRDAVYCWLQSPVQRPTAAGAFSCKRKQKDWKAICSTEDISTNIKQRWPLTLPCHKAFKLIIVDLIVKSVQRILLARTAMRRYPCGLCKNASAVLMMMMNAVSVVAVSFYWSLILTLTFSSAVATLNSVRNGHDVAPPDSLMLTQRRTYKGKTHNESRILYTVLLASSS